MSAYMNELPGADRDVGAPCPCECSCPCTCSNCNCGCIEEGVFTFHSSRVSIEYSGHVGSGSMSGVTDAHIGLRG